jgi:hypothetical protein
MIMILLVVLLILLGIVTGVLGFVVKGLIWLAIIGIVLFLIGAAVGMFNRGRSRV